MLKDKISFDFYYNTYSCENEGDLDAENFDRYINRAKRVLDSFLGKEDFTPDERLAVMLCICEIAESLYREENISSVKSETVDGYSVTFNREGSIKERIRTIVLGHLGKTGLLYAGVE
ncbi:MAG: hypothetical protein IKB32_03195 [Clostridia bacterium]|nr:hypothetical protein [Clostridia bacterium]